MKKNRMMRLASILMVCVLLTTSVISGTYAKYVTSDSANDTARVAKWGVEVLVSGNLFGAHYNPNNAADNNDGIVATVAHSADKGNYDFNGIPSIVAPGTKNNGTGFTVKLSGQPEVAYTVTARTGAFITVDYKQKPVNEDIFLGAGTWGVMVKAEGLQLGASLKGYYSYDEADKVYKPVADNEVFKTGVYYELHDMVVVDSAYYPLNWTVTHSGEAKEITTTKNLKAIADEMVAGIERSGGANDSVDAGYVLSWEWPFEVGELDTNDGYLIYATDAKDTILGNLMANNVDPADVDGQVVKLQADSTTYTAPGADDYNLDIVFNFEVAVTQVD